MQEIHGNASGRVGAAPDSVFRLITDIDRLPEWNRAIEGVVERPTQLAKDAEWVVKMHPSRIMVWKSRSHVEELDPDTLRFAYRTTNEDGNPSYTQWKWEITPVDGASNVTVSWDVYLKTADRRLVAGPIRQRQLRKEVAQSLLALQGAIASGDP